MESKISFFIQSVQNFLSDVKSYAFMLCALLITNDTAVLFSFFVSMLFLDYITGAIASSIEQKNSGEEIKVYATKSKRFRESGVKVIGYFIIIIGSAFISNFIYTDNISLFGVIKDFTVFQLSLLMCSGIEFWSNIENSKRMGFDIVGKFTNFAGSIWKLIRSVKGVGILLLLMSTGCMSVKKAERVMRANPSELARLCSDCFPVKPIEVIKGRVDTVINEVLKVDSVRIKVQGDCPDGTVIEVDCPPEKVITRIVTTHSTDTVKVRDTAKEKVLEDENKVLEKWKLSGLIGWGLFGFLTLIIVLKRRV